MTCPLCFGTGRFEIEHEQGVRPCPRCKATGRVARFDVRAAAMKLAAVLFVGGWVLGVLFVLLDITLR